MDSILSQVKCIREENGLKLYHYDDNIEHPNNLDDWKGIVMDENVVVARSYSWSNTIISQTLPTEKIYSPLYEATIIRFYRVNGKCFVGTHRQINIIDKKSRIANYRPFIELVKEAISIWPPVDEKRFTPKSIEDLCHDGWCHVFLLIDQSNQITDQLDISKYFVSEDSKDIKIHPLLLHSISFKIGMNTDENGVCQMIPIKPLDVEIEGIGKLCVPCVQEFSFDEALAHISDGNPIIVVEPNDPTKSTKYHPERYQYKLDLAGETFNPVHRWHQLMDESEYKATEYLSIIPHHLKPLTLEQVKKTAEEYVGKICKTLVDNIVDRFYGKDATLDQRLYKKTIDVITSLVKTLRDKFDFHAKKKDVRKEAEILITNYLNSLSYSDRHSMHGMINRVEHDQSKTKA